MQTASSAKRTCRLSASAVEKTATVLMPISRQVRMIRRAISPRLAMSILLNILVWLVNAWNERLGGQASVGVHQEEHLIVFYRAFVFDHHFDDGTADLRFNFVEELHGFDDADYIAFFDVGTHFDVRWLVGGR